MPDTRILNPLRLLLVLLLAVSAVRGGENEFLEPEQAYRLSTAVEDPGAVTLSWDIADGYYLYRDKFSFASDTPGIELGEPQLPPSRTKQDPYFGDVEIYKHRVDIRIPLRRDAGSGELLRLKTVSQGCAEAGLCYPPQKQTVEIPLPPAAPADDDSSDALSPLQALATLGSSLGIDDDNRILTPEQAYQLKVGADAKRLQLNWTIAEGTYLYQDKVQVRLLDGEGVRLGRFELPPAKIKKNALRPDGTTGDLPVYVGRLNLTIPLQRSDPGPTGIRVQAIYQGCAEAGVCYPPQKKEVSLALPAVTETAAPATAAPPAAPDALERARQAVLETTPAAPVPAPAGDAEAEVSEQDRIATTLAGGSTWLIVLTFFGLGLLLAFTPCVFPMIPILSGIIAGQGSTVTTRRAFTLSLVYVLAMSVTYTIAGVLAGLFGQNLQATFQNPWILGSFAVIFVLLALSMFGFYDLQLPSRWQSRLSEASSRQRSGRYTGVAVMGFLSALIVGPCVAPPLAGALIYIGQTGDALLGGVGLFSLAMGMGAPLLVIGASAGRLLPRVGPWMNTVKAVFGVGLLAVAIVLLERIVPPAVAMLLWGTLLVVSAVYMGALQQLPVEASGWDRLWRGLGCVLLIYGALMLVGVAAGGRDTVQPLRGLLPGALLAGSSGGSAGGELHFKRIKSLEDLQREVAAASAAGRPVMLDFYADWCVSCKELERYTFSDPAVHRALGDAVLLQADVTADDARDRALLQGHFGLPGPPAIIFYGRDGRERRAYRVVGFLDAEEFADHVRKAFR